jgi:hypothetical protein
MGKLHYYASNCNIGWLSSVTPDKIAVTCQLHKYTKFSMYVLAYWKS